MLARRSRVGDNCQLFDGRGWSADGTITAIGPTVATVRIGPPQQTNQIFPYVVVLQALIKGDRMDVCLEKLVETGADHIVLVATERSIVKVAAETSDARQQRRTAQIQAAARQCERAYVPSIIGPLSLAEAIAHVPADADKRATDPHGAPWPMHTANRKETLVVAIGPEGGFSPAEYEQLRLAGFSCYSISPYVLRAETAGPVAVALARASQAT